MSNTAAWLTPVTSPAAWSAQLGHCSVASIFATLVSAIVTKGLQRAQQQFDSTKDITQDEYDFIVVGGGTSGCAVVHRLSEVSSWKVLLLEAGGEETEYNNVPALNSRYMKGPLVWWSYKSQPSAWDPGSSLDRGKGLGGFTVLNGMHLVRGHPADYDRWAARGNPGWSYADVLPYFRKAENNLNPELARDTKYHGTGGPQDEQTDPYRDLNTELYMKAFEEIGYPYVKDSNGAHLIGVSMAQSATGHGERRSTNTAYLKKIRSRPNLTVQTHAEVQRVLLSAAKVGPPRAAAVEFIGPGGRRRVVRARKEVILSAGPYNTPQLLMLSGIGPRKHLELAKVAVRVDLPGVGQRLQDHQLVDTAGSVRFDLTTTRPDLGTAEQRIAAVREYIARRTGPLAAEAQPANAYLRTKHQPKGDPRPDIKILLGQGYVEKRTEGCAKGDPLSTFGNTLQFRPGNLHPKSRGQILLNTTHPTSAPLIYTNVFADESDVGPIVESFRLLKKLSATRVFRSNGIKLNLSVPKECKQLQEDSDAYWKCFLGKHGKPRLHPTSSCSMGPDSDPLAVVDARLKVRGVAGLRVVDVAVMPETPSGNTHAAGIMIGEKGSDIIKSDWQH